MNVSDVLDFCKRHKVSPSEYMVLKMLKAKSEGYTKLFEKFVEVYSDADGTAMANLVIKGIVIKRGGMDKPKLWDFYINPDISEEMFRDSSMGEELYKAYPAVFPLSDGKSFIARTGGDKDFLMDLYLRKIDFSHEMHLEVMKQLKRYKKLVETGKLNGHKLIDWVSNEMWNIVKEIPEETSGGFKMDI